MPVETVDNTDDQLPDEGGVESTVDETTTGSEIEAGAEVSTAGEEDVFDPASPDLSDEEIQALIANPAELRKSVMRNRDYTRKAQGVARMRDFMEAFERDPQGVARRMAIANGLRLAEDPAPGAAATPTPVQAARDQIAGVLGEEAADALVPALRQLAESVVAPDRQRVDHILGQTALTQAESVLDSFTAKVPEWRKLEKQMVALSREIQPQRGTDPLKYMQMLHTLASASASRADQARALTGRVTTAVRGSESRTTGTPASRISNAPPRKPTFDEAWDAASRGKRFEF